jgi:hypothetical protein
MPGKPIRIGPFVNGLNNVSLSGEAKETELVKLINFEVGPDSSLWSRPPFETVTASLMPSTITAQYQVLGIYRTTTTEWYLIVATPQVDGTVKINAYLGGDLSLAPTLIKTVPVGSKVTAFVQVADYGYFCVSPSSAIAGFKWKYGSAVADVTQMKKGNCMVAYQSRLWIAGIDTANQSSTLYFSTIDATGIQLDLWSATDFINVAPGEGGFITALLPLNASILVFKNEGTWRWTYPSSPKSGRVDKVSGSVGASGATSVVEFENYVYVYDQGRVYELVNNNYTQLNRFVKFDLDSSSVDGTAPGVDLSVMNRRLVLRYFNTIYSYAIDSRAWSQWQSYLGTPGRLYELPADSNSTTPSTYIGASQAQTQNPSVNLGPSFTDAEILYINSLCAVGFTASRVGADLKISSTVNSTTNIYLNSKDGATGYSLKLGPGQKYNVSFTNTRTAGTLALRMTYLMHDGSVSTVDSASLGSGAISYSLTVPDNAVLGFAMLRYTTTGTADITFTGLQITRTNETAAVTLIKITDQYAVSANTVEYIDCYMRTKSYDYDTPSAMKRLFWWGADIKTNRFVEGTVIPVAVKLPPKWGDLQAYTHAQLSAGTWGNPLSFLQSSLSVIDGGDPTNAQTENGRIFVKLKKSLRFRQLSFEMHMSTLGNKATGPAKIHSLVSLVVPKEKVVDRFT